MDEGDSKNEDTKIERQERTFDFFQRYIVDACYVFFTAWIRCIIQIYNGYHRFVLDGGYRILLNFRMLLVILYLTWEIFK